MYPSLILLMSLISLTFSCEIDDGDDYSTGTCACPDMRTLLNTTRVTYKNPTVTRLAGCTYNFTCNCFNTTSIFCGYIHPKTLSNMINLPTSYGAVGVVDALIEGAVPQNIFETFDMQCINGSWYAMKIPYPVWFEGEDRDGGIIQIRYGPEDLVNTTIRIPPNSITC